jgi:hypothetical protein
MARIDTDPFRRFAELDRLKKSLEADLKKVKADIAGLQETLLEQATEAGMRSINVTVGDEAFTVYLKRDVRARNLQGPDETAAAVAKIPHLAHLAQPRVNANTLAAVLKEMLDGDGLPPEFEGVIEPLEQFSMQVRKA